MKKILLNITTLIFCLWAIIVGIVTAMITFVLSWVAAGPYILLSNSKHKLLSTDKWEITKYLEVILDKVGEMHP